MTKLNYKLNVPYANKDGLWVGKQIKGEGGVECFVLLLASEKEGNKIAASCMSERGLINKMYQLIK